MTYITFELPLQIEFDPDQFDRYRVNFPRTISRPINKFKIRTADFQCPFWAE